jgi:hypothetical protein
MELKMNRHAPDATTIDAALKLLTEHGCDDMARAIEVLLGEAMKIARSAFLGASPYERSDERVGYANGYKRKSVSSRLGELELSISKVRGFAEGLEPFYPRSLERGERSERPNHSRHRPRIMHPTAFGNPPRSTAQRRRCPVSRHVHPWRLHIDEQPLRLFVHLDVLVVVQEP